VFNTQDAHGPIRRGTVLLSCSSARVLDTIVAADPALATIVQGSGIPTTNQACTQSTQAGGAGDSTPGSTQPGSTPPTLPGGPVRSANDR
jgi:phospholipid/cholesterol/gamma-HCH transport system substrate-binding protein